MTTRTYWLYFGGKVIASVRARKGASGEEIRAKALADHDRCPYVGGEPGEAPYEHRARILRATIEE